MVVKVLDNEDPKRDKFAKLKGDRNLYNDHHHSNDKEESLDLILDANCTPTLEMLILDKNLTKFLQITNVIQTFFEALPLTLL